MEPAPKRFLEVTDDDITEIRERRVPESTKKTTAVWLHMFAEFLESSHLQCDLKTCTKTELAEVLCKCYLSMRRKDGKNYQEPGYLGFRAAIQRELTRFDRKMNIFTDQEFRVSNDVLDGVLKKLRRDGMMAPIAHKVPISEEDMEKINYLFCTNKDAHTIQLQVWFSLTLHLGLRGRELQAKLTKSDLEIGNDGNGEYIQLSTDFATKNYQGGTSGSTRRNMGEGLITDNCQIISFKTMMQKLHPDCPRLFQRVRAHYNTRDDVWYCNSPLGKSSLANMMKNISKAAKPSTEYTNHCLRATVVSTLSASGVEDRHIMSVTGHKAARSLAAYSKSTAAQQRSMSRILDGRTSSVELPPVQVTTASEMDVREAPRADSIDQTFSTLTDEEFDFLFTDFRDVDVSTASNIDALPPPPTNDLLQLDVQQPLPPLQPFSHVRPGQLQQSTPTATLVQQSVQCPAAQTMSALASFHGANLQGAHITFNLSTKWSVTGYNKNSTAIISATRLQLSYLQVVSRKLVDLQTTADCITSTLYN